MSRKPLAIAHLVGNAILLWLAYYWLGVGESTISRIIWSAILATLILVAAVWLHGSGFSDFKAALRNLVAPFPASDPSLNPLRPSVHVARLQRSACFQSRVLPHSKAAQTGEARCSPNDPQRPALACPLVASSNPPSAARRANRKQRLERLSPLTNPTPLALLDRSNRPVTRRHLAPAETNRVGAQTYKLQHANGELYHTGLSSLLTICNIMPVTRTLQRICRSNSRTICSRSVTEIPGFTRFSTNTCNSS